MVPRPDLNAKFVLHRYHDRSSAAFPFVRLAPFSTVELLIVPTIVALKFTSQSSAALQVIGAFVSRGLSELILGVGTQRGL
jgi:hypothetical protein